MRVLSWKHLTIATLALVALVVSAGDSLAQATRSFDSNGRSVRVDEFRASGPGLKPAVMILHGASGLGDGTLLYPLARNLRDRGINAYVVRYFDGLSAPAAAAPANRQAPGVRPAAQQRQTRGNPSSPSLHARRDSILTDALAFITSQPDVDSTRLGLFGLSLGGFHSLDIASRDRRIQAVVSFVGAMPASGGERSLSYMPPTLLLHGTADRVVPFARVQRLHANLVAAGAPVQMTTFRGAGHSFRGHDLVRAHEEAADFLERTLIYRGGRDSFVAYRFQ